MASPECARRPAPAVEPLTQSLTNRATHSRGRRALGGSAGTCGGACVGDVRALRVENESGKWTQVTGMQGSTNRSTCSSCSFAGI